MQIIAFSRLTPHPIWKQVQMQLTIFATLKGKYSKLQQISIMLMKTWLCLTWTCLKLLYKLELDLPQQI